MDEELENNGQGESGPESTTTSDFDSQSTTDNSQGSSGEEFTGNPAWKAGLEPIPQEFHPHLESVFGEWDKGVQTKFQKVQQELAPLKAYKEFADLGVPTNELQEAMQIRHLLNTQPKDLYEYLQKQHNFGQESQGQKNAETPDYDLSNEEYDLEKDPRFQAVAQQAQFAQAAIQENQRIQMEAKIQQEIDSEVKVVQEKFPGLKISDVATMAQGLPNANQKGALIAAAERMAAYLPKERASDSAPPVLSGNRGLPSPTTNYGKMTSEERSKLVADLISAQQSG
jgi:hypothetical protein